MVFLTCIQTIQTLDAFIIVNHKVSHLFGINLSLFSPHNHLYSHLEARKLRREIVWLVVYLVGVSGFKLGWLNCTADALGLTLQFQRTNKAVNIRP